MKNLLVLTIAALLAMPAWAQSNPIEIEEWTVEWRDTRPRDPVVAEDGRVWFVGQAGDYAAVFDPATEEFFSITPIPSGGGAVRHMVFDEQRNAIWFGTDTNNLGLAKLPE